MGEGDLAFGSGPMWARCRTLQLDVLADGDPVRWCRMVSAMVNNTELALVEVLVHGRPAWPVADADIPSGAPRRLLFRIRDTTGVLDQLLVEQTVAIVARTGLVVDARRHP